MSYDHLNIGQLLFLLPNAELKQRVRNLERFYKRYVRAKTGILFNKTCLNETTFLTNNIIHSQVITCSLQLNFRNEMHRGI